MGVSGVCVCSVDLPRAFVCVKEWEKVSLSLSECTSLSRPFKNRLVTLSHLPLIWKPCGNRTFNPFSIINSSDWFFLFFYTDTRVAKGWWTCNCDLIWKWCKKKKSRKERQSSSSWDVASNSLFPWTCFILLQGKMDRWNQASFLPNVWCKEILKSYNYPKCAIAL